MSALRVSVLSAGVLAAAAACGPSAGPPLSQVSASSGALSFDYPAIGGSGRLSSESTRGRVTVIALVTTYDLGSQLVLRELVELVHSHEPRINVGVIVLEPPRNALLVQAFSETLELPFPTALADVPTLEARGPFGEVRAVPTLVVLNPAGLETWRQAGVVTVADIGIAVDRAQRAAPASRSSR